MEIKIVSRWDSEKVILCGKYESIKDCLEKNRGADLSGADLSGTDLSGTYLRGACLRGTYLRGADLRGTDLRGTYLRGADLRGTDLRGTCLRGTCLRGADLRDADLRDAKNYSESHDFFKELIRRETVETFTEKEWTIIGQIIVHSLCWDSIKKRFNEEAMPIFKKLSKAEFGEYKNKYKDILKEESL